MSTRILFVGDSITDAGRVYENPTDMGRGYPLLIKAFLGLDCPDIEFINRGVNGNRIVDLYARIKKDIINLKPDVISVFIGINDVWHDIDWDNGVETSKFIKIYEMFLDEILTALPKIKIILISPFVLEGKQTMNRESDEERFSKFRFGTDEKINAVKSIAEKYKLPLIDLQAEFDKRCEIVSPVHFSLDGVHPTPEGHELIKRVWLDAYNLNDKQEKTL